MSSNIVKLMDINKIEEDGMFTASAKNERMLLVNAGKKVTLTANIISAGKLTKDLIENANSDALAWREGTLIFSGETLEEVIQEMSRYSNVDVEFKDEHLKSIRIGGRFTTGDITGLLDVLNQQFDIKSSRLSRSRIQLSQNNA